jgi:hypothetical protein
LLLPPSLPPPLPLPPLSLNYPKLRLALKMPRHTQQTQRNNTCSEHDDMCGKPDCNDRKHDINNTITHLAGALHCLCSLCCCMGRVGTRGECDGDMTQLVSPSGARAYTRRRVIPRDASGQVIPREELAPGELESSGLWVMDTPWTRESLARGNVPFE